MDMDTLFERMSDGMHVGRSFGPPIERGDVTVVPVAMVAGGGGGGVGEQPGPEPGDPTSTGTGAGYGLFSWPLGAYVVKDGDVRFVPAFDATRVALAALGVLRLAMKIRAFRHQHRARAGAGG